MTALTGASGDCQQIAAQCVSFVHKKKDPRPGPVRAGLGRVGYAVGQFVGSGRDRPGACFEPESPPPLSIADDGADWGVCDCQQIAAQCVSLVHFQKSIHAQGQSGSGRVRYAVGQSGSGRVRVSNRKAHPYCPLLMTALTGASVIVNRSPRRSVWQCVMYICKNVDPQLLPKNLTWPQRRR
jgi:hypothetical protein